MIRYRLRIGLAVCTVLLLSAVPTRAQATTEAVVSIRGPIRAVHLNESGQEGGWLYATNDVLPLRAGACVRVVSAGAEAIVRLRSGAVQRLHRGQRFCVPARRSRKPTSTDRVRHALSGTFQTVVTLLAGPPPPTWARPLESRGDSTNTEPLLLLPDTLIWATLDRMPTLTWIGTATTEDQYAISVFPADAGCGRTGAAVAEGRSSGKTYTLPRALPRGRAFRVELARAGGAMFEHGCLRVAGDEEARQAENAVRAVRDDFGADALGDPAGTVFLAAWLVDAGLQVDALALLHAEAERAPQRANARAMLALLARYERYLAPRIREDR